MKDQLKTIQTGLAIAIDAEGFVDKPVRRALLDAVKAAAQLEAMAGEQEPVAKLHDDGYWTPMKTEAGRALNERLLRAGSPSIEVYTTAPVAQQPQADSIPVAAFDRLMALCESQAQRIIELEDKQPQGDEATSAGLEASISILSQLVDEQRQLLAEVDAVFGVDAHGIVLEDGDSALIDRVRSHLAATNEAQQPQAEPDIHEAQGQIEFLDKKNNALSAAIRKVMARLADLLDEDQFKEIEEIVSFAGVQPQAEAVPLTHVLVPVDEPTDEMVDAACAAVDGLCRVDFVRAYVAAFAHLKAGYRDESYWCGWNAAIKFQQAEAVPVVDRVYEAAKRLVDHADFQLGGVLSAKSKARDIPSNAASKVKARHLASLRDALAKTPQQAEAVPQWLPIETAPKGQRVMVWIADKEAGENIAFAKVWFHADGTLGGGAEGFNGRWDLTHWMPLPPPPGIVGEKGGA